MANIWLSGDFEPELRYNSSTQIPGFHTNCPGFHYIAQNPRCIHSYEI
jgi:hypothetical protein